MHRNSKFFILEHVAIKHFAIKNVSTLSASFWGEVTKLFPTRFSPRVSISSVSAGGGEKGTDFFVFLNLGPAEGLSRRSCHACRDPVEEGARTAGARGQARARWERRGHHPVAAHRCGVQRLR